VKLRDTFLRTHLWVVSSLPTPDDSILAFNVTDRATWHDHACIIYPDEHPFIVKESVIAYLRGSLLPKHGEFLEKSLRYQPRQPPVSEELLKRIQEGALASDFTKQDFQDIIRASMARQPAK
jgi:hypothetical protein